MTPAEPDNHQHDEPSDTIKEPESEHLADEADIHGMHDPIMREKERPRDGYQPISLTLVFLFFGLIGWGGWYLGAYSGDWRVDVFYPGQQMARVSEGDKQKEEMTPDKLRSLGERVYMQCASCHQNDGKGMGGNFPPLDGSKWVTESKDRLVAILLHGLQGSITVKGDSYSGMMPAWGNRLSNKQIAGVLTYVRSAWSNKADAIKPKRVERVKKDSSDRTKPWTAAELEETFGDK
jgi:mono/diheme cytochrome c family protein